MLFAENLQSDRYANGDEIPGNLNDSERTWAWFVAQTVYGEGSSPVLSGIDDEVVNLATYGRLYNWYAVDDSRGLCSIGWYVPSDKESTDSTNFHRGEPSAAPVLKSSPSDTPGWDGTNTAGFSALPGGLRNGTNRYFYDLGHSGSWWTDSPLDTSHAWMRSLYSANGNVVRGAYDMHMGFSVRCVRD